MRLPPDAGKELIDLLQANRGAITKMAEFEKVQQDRAMKKIWELLLDSHRKKEKDEIGVNIRPIMHHRSSPMVYH